MFAEDDALDSNNTVPTPKKKKKINVFPCQVHTASVCPLGPQKKGRKEKQCKRMRNPSRDEQKPNPPFQVIR